MFIHDLRICVANNCSRGQLATLNLPPVIQIPDDDIELVVDPGRLNNPLQSPVRPSESAITKGYRLMDAATGEDSDDEDFDTAVKFGDLGVFDSRALDLWMKASKASSIIFRVQEEENWMKTTSTTLTPQQINEIRALLFDSEPQDEILRIGDVMVDAEDLSTLAAERYISGFLIDAACLRYTEETMRKNSHSLYLPSFTQTWALTRNVQFLQTKLKPYLSRMDLGDVIWILTPIHVNGNHWGLHCLNMAQRQAFYDDGLKQSPPSNIIELPDNLLKALSETQWNITFPITLGIFDRFLTTPPVFGHARTDLWVEYRPIPRWTLKRSGA